MITCENISLVNYYANTKWMFARNTEYYQTGAIQLAPTSLKSFGQQMFENQGVGSVEEIVLLLKAIVAEHRPVDRPVDRRLTIGRIHDP